MIGSKENSQLAHCLCGILVTSKERTMDREISLQSITEDICTICVYEALRHQFQKCI